MCVTSKEHVYIARVFAVCTFVMYLIKIGTGEGRTKSIEIMEPGECYRDQQFIATDSLNKYFKYDKELSK